MSQLPTTTPTEPTKSTATMPSINPSASITPTLFFTGNALPAAELYTKVFDNSKINKVTHYPDNPSTSSSMSSSTPMIISLTLFSHTPSPLDLLLLNLPADQAASFPHKFNESFSLSVVVDTQEEIDWYWGQLTAAGGEEKECCWCKDPFGVSWQIVPRLLIKAMEAGGDKAVRAQQAMFGWKKANIRELEEALKDD